MGVQLRQDIVSLIEPERRSGPRTPVETYLNVYTDDLWKRGFTADISEAGLYLNCLPGQPLPPCKPIGLEFELPGIRETIWAAGEICFDRADDYFVGQGIRFTAMAGLHARLIRQYCLQLCLKPTLSLVGR